VKAGNGAKLKAWLHAMQSGDGATLVAGLADAVVFETPSDQWDAIIPYVGTANGKEAVLASFATRAKIVDTVSLHIVNSSTAGRHGFAEMRSRERLIGSGREFDIHSLHHFTFDEAGLIERWQSFFDPDPETAALALDLPVRLIAAVGKGDTAEAAACLGHGAAPDTVDPDSGLSVLMMAACRGFSETVDLLLSHGANPHFVDSGGGTALHKAAQAGSLAIAKSLVEAGAFIDATACTTGHTPLMDAIWFGAVDVVRYLLDQNASVGIRSFYGFSIAEHFEYEARVNTAQTDAFKAMKDLIDARHARDAKAAADQVLMAAVVANDLEAAKAALAGGADVNERAPITGNFNNGHTPLHVAAREGKTEIVGVLLKAGADVNAVEPTFMAVPLHKSVYNGHAEITRMLAASPGVNLDFQGASNGYAPLHDAIWHGYAECADILVTAGARVDRPGHDGMTPLDLARRTFGEDHPTTRAILARFNAQS
jgi:uncharacterized protein